MKVVFTRYGDFISWARLDEGGVRGRRMKKAPQRELKDDVLAEARLLSG
jgi:hypothetical protein